MNLRLRYVLPALALLSAAAMACTPAGQSATPTPRPTLPAVSENPPGCRYTTVQRIQVCIPAGLGLTAAGYALPRSPEPAPDAHEALRLLVFDEYPVRDPRVQGAATIAWNPQVASIAVFALADFDRATAYDRATIAALRALLARRPALTQPEPFAGTDFGLTGFFPAGTPFQVKPAYLPLAWGSGVRGVVQLSQDFQPPRNGTLQYVFNGISADNRWLVVASFPLAAEAMPQIAESDQQLGSDPRPAIERVRQFLEGLRDDQYRVPLPVLDALVQSLIISP